MAMPAAATRSFRTPVHPPVPAVLALFDRLGGALPIADGAQFEAIYTSMGTFAPFFEYLTVLSDFLVDHGLPAADAQRLIASVFVDVARPLSRRGAGLRRDGARVRTAWRRQRAADDPDARNRRVRGDAPCARDRPRAAGRRLTP